MAINSGVIALYVKSHIVSNNLQVACILNNLGTINVSLFRDEGIFTIIFNSTVILQTNCNIHISTICTDYPSYNFLPFHSFFPCFSEFDGTRIMSCFFLHHIGLILPHILCIFLFFQYIDQIYHIFDSRIRCSVFVTHQKYYWRSSVYYLCIAFLYNILTDCLQNSKRFSLKV